MTVTQALEVKGLEKSFGSVQAVRGVDLSVRAGESVGLLGPNGAGKTTTLRILATLLAPDAGEIRVLGLDPITEGGALRARIGVVPQEIALYDGLTAEENLAFFANLQGLKGADRDASVGRALETAGLTDRRASRVEGFSGGMKRRLNLVAALLHDPDIVFLDEPTAGVDPQSRNHVFEQVEALHAAGTTLIYTTHQMGEVERLCDRIVIMDRGLTISDGTLEELRSEARSASDEMVKVLSGGTAEDAARVLRDAGFEAEAAAAHASLEMIFLALTGRGLRDGDDD